MHLIIALIVFAVLAAIIVWVADWTSVGGGRSRNTLFSVLIAPLASDACARQAHELGERHVRPT